MILTCPKCETQYFADGSTIGESGRTVKCAACNHSWFVAPEGAKKAESAAPPAHEVYRERVREQRRQQSRFAALLSWLVTAAVFFAIGIGSILLRNDVVKVWPQSAGVYKRLGFPVNRFGLEFADIERSRTFNDTIPVITVTGKARNVARTEIISPAVRVTLKDEAGKPVVTTHGRLSAKKLAPGKSASFEIVIEPAPVESFEIGLSFSDLSSLPKELPKPAPPPAAAQIPTDPEATPVPAAEVPKPVP